MSSPRNKYRAAMDVIQRGRDILVDGMAEAILDQREDLAEGGFVFHEFLESQGTRLHFLGVILAQLEQSAESVEVDDAQRAAEAEAAAALASAASEARDHVMRPAPRKRKPRAKKVQQTSAEGRADES